VVKVITEIDCINTEKRVFLLMKICEYQMNLLNGRLRKVLDWETPYDAFEKSVGVALKT